MCQSAFVKQERGRKTVDALLNAAEALLDEKGVDAATVPAIAERAHVSVGTLYRHFPDKDALLRAVYERFFTNVRAMNSVLFGTMPTERIPAATIIRGVVTGLIEGYRRRRGLLQALIRYSRTHPDPEFRRAAQEMNRAGIDALAGLLRRYSDEIDHPDPAKAVEFGMYAVASTLQGIILEEDPLFALNVPDNLRDEVTRLLSGYLGISGDAAPPPHVIAAHTAKRQPGR